MARDLDGATLAFEPDAYGDGTQVRLLAQDATGALIPTNLPPLHARAIIEETLSLGKPPFAFVVHANGALGGRPGFRVGDDSSTEVGCPPGGAFHFLVHTANASAERFVPCRIALANTGPVSLSSLQPEPTAPPPTPCSGIGCTTPSLPAPPSSTPTCPASFTPVQGGCIPTPTPTPNAGAHYHLTTAGAPPTLSAGGTASFTAQATLTNAASVPPGTPASIPVFVAGTTAGICAATPPGSQPSGSSFTVTALLVGTCTITIQGDTSSVIGSSADTASITITISNAPAPTPTPTPQSCDLTQNGICFHQIVDPTAVQFWKYVVPSSQCLGADGENCSYQNSIANILLYNPYIIQPVVAPSDSSHEILIRIDAIAGVTSECLPYSAFESTPATNPIVWGGSTIGAPANPPAGFGEPSIFSTVNHLQVVPANGQANFDDAGQAWTGTTLADLYNATVTRQIDAPYSFTYSSSDATSGTQLEWFPDFAGCDAAADPLFVGGEFGIAGVQLLFEVYQAMP